LTNNRLEFAELKKPLGRLFLLSLLQQSFLPQMHNRLLAEGVFSGRFLMPVGIDPDVHAGRTTVLIGVKEKK